MDLGAAHYLVAGSAAKVFMFAGSNPQGDLNLCVLVQLK
jgi:hypothetical protein